MKKKIAIITGASSGIGQEFAFQLDEIMHELDEIWLIARRRERLEELAKVLETGCRTIAMDVTEERDMELFRNILATEDVSVRMLVNCAGYGLMGRFDGISIEEQLGMLEVNCKALTRMTYVYVQKRPYHSTGIQRSFRAPKEFCRICCCQILRS